MVWQLATFLSKVSQKGNIGLAKRAVLGTLGDVDIRLLRVFVVVAECNGIAASELELNIGKSTISRHISDLEKRIGLRLCDRGPSGFNLTSEGRQVLDHTRQLLLQIDEFQSQIDSIQRNLKGTIRVGIFDQSSTNPNGRLHQAIAEFDEIAPDVAINILLDSPSALEAGVTSGALDLAVVPNYQPSSALRYRPLYTESMCLYCGQGHPLFGLSDAEVQDRDVDLSAYKYAGYGFNSPNMRAGHKLRVKRAAQVKDEEALALLIQSGRYLGYLADHVAVGLGAAQSVWPVLRDQTAYSVQFAAVVRKRPEPDRKTTAFLECLTSAHSPAD